MPAPESVPEELEVRDEVKSCSDRPDEAWAWLNDVYDQSCTRKELEDKLQDPGKFLALDTKLSAALTRSAGGDLATRNPELQRAAISQGHLGRRQVCLTYV